MSSEVMLERGTQEGSVSDRVISAVAATKGMDSMDLDPLYNVIDPDALDTLYDRSGFGRAPSPERIEFTYSGCRVVITGNASITVSEAAPRTPQ